MQAPGDAFLASTLSYFQGRETIEHFTWSPEQTLESAVSFSIHPKEYVCVTIDDEGLSTGAYIEFDIDVGIDDGIRLVLREVIPPSHHDGEFTVVDTDLIMCKGSGRYGIELRPEFVRGGLIGGEDTVTSTAPSMPRYWTYKDKYNDGVYFLVRLNSGSANNFSVYLCAGEVKPKPFWTDGQGCNYVIQAGVNQ